CTSVGLWKYHESPLYLSYLKAQWQALDEIDAIPFPEIQAENFTQAKFWELTHDLKYPVIIRKALVDSPAVNQWNRDYFVENYPESKVLARQVTGPDRFRVVKATMRDYWDAYEHGGNISIVASSTIF